MMSGRLPTLESVAQTVNDDGVVRSTEETTTCWDDWRKAYDIESTYEDNHFPSDCPSSEVLDGIRLRTVDWFESLELVQRPGSLENPREETPIMQGDEFTPESSPWTRLLKWEVGAITEFTLDDMPPYVAVSHVWAHQLFPIERKADVLSTYGMKQLSLFLSMRSDWPMYQYLWIDTWCIDQDSEQDKLRQIPLMADIYAKAGDVLVMALVDFGFWQFDWDTEVEALGEAIKIYKSLGPTSSELRSLFRKKQIGYAVFKLMEMITTLAKMEVNQRIWTAQEYILAKRVAWMSSDGLSLRIDPIVVCAVIDMFDNFNQLREQNATWIDQVIDFHLLNKLKCTPEDPTAAMGLTRSRRSTLDHDQIYGLMGASSVVIDAKERGTELVRDTWRRWFFSAINQGHYQWLSAPMVAPSTSGEGIRNCAFAPLQRSWRAARHIDYSGRSWLGPASWVDNGVFTLCRNMGVINDIHYVGDFSKGSFTSASDFLTQLSTNQRIPEIVAAATSGRLSKLGVENLVRAMQPLLDLFYQPAEMELIRQGKITAEEVAKCFPDNSEGSIRRVINPHVRGKTYLGTLRNNNTSTSILFVSQDEIPPEPLFAADLGAYDMSDNERLWRSLWIGKNCYEEGMDNTVFEYLCHKVGTSYPVMVADPGLGINQAQDLNIHIADLDGRSPILIGGDYCPWCQGLDIARPVDEDGELPGISSDFPQI